MRLGGNRMPYPDPIPGSPGPPIAKLNYIVLLLPLSRCVALLYCTV